jgi:hypothetical protein
VLRGAQEARGKAKRREIYAELKELRLELRQREVCTVGGHDMLAF